MTEREPEPAHSQQPEPSRAPTPSVAPVSAGMRCCRCGYDLAGLSRDSECPECAGPIIDSLRFHAIGRPLQLCGPAHLRRLRRGALLLLWSSGAGALMLPVLGFVAAGGFMQNPWGQVINPAVAMALCAAIAAHTTGQWLITSREPGIDEAVPRGGALRRGTVLRRCARIAVVVFAVAAGAALADALLPMSVLPRTGGLWWLTPASVLVPLVVSFGVHLAHLGSIAARAGVKGAADRAFALFGTLGAVLIVGLVAAVANDLCMCGLSAGLGLLCAIVGGVVYLTQLDSLTGTLAALVKGRPAPVDAESGEGA